MSDPLATPWTVACQAPLSMGFPRQEYYSGLPFPALGDLPDSGLEPVSPALADRFFTTEPPRRPRLPELQACALYYLIELYNYSICRLAFELGKLSAFWR